MLRFTTVPKEEPSVAMAIRIAENNPLYRFGVCAQNLYDKVYLGYNSPTKEIASMQTMVTDSKMLMKWPLNRNQVDSIATTRL